MSNGFLEKLMNGEIFDVVFAIVVVIGLLRLDYVRKRIELVRIETDALRMHNLILGKTLESNELGKMGFQQILATNREEGKIILFANVTITRGLTFVSLTTRREISERMKILLPLLKDNLERSGLKVQVHHIQ